MFGSHDDLLARQLIITVNKIRFNTMKIKDEDSTDAMRLCDIWRSLDFRKTPIKSQAKEDHQLSLDGPSNRQKSSGPKQLKWIASGWANIKSDTRSYGVTLKSTAMLSTVIGLITEYADCRMTFKS